jgi:hypothetical protein
VVDYSHPDWPQQVLDAAGGTRPEVVFECAADAHRAVEARDVIGKTWLEI